MTDELTLHNTDRDAWLRYVAPNLARKLATDTDEQAAAQLANHSGRLQSGCMGALGCHATRAYSPIEEVRMNIIVAGEESGVTRDAFAKMGHNAWSCDLKPSRRPGQHYQGSWRDICWSGFDLAVMHPECTHLAVSGSRWFPQKRADGRQQAAIDEFLYLANAPVYASCVEQPISIMSSLYRKPDQIVQPWMFGRWETKALCYWLKNLPRLKVMYRTVGDAREALGLPAGSKPEAKVHKCPPGRLRAQIRSESFPEIAAAMAMQWSGQVERLAEAA